MAQVRFTEYISNLTEIIIEFGSFLKPYQDFFIINYLIGTEDDDEIMGDDGLMGGTTTVDDLKISGNISATNTSIIGGKLILSRNTGTNEDKRNVPLFLYSTIAS